MGKFIDLTGTRVKAFTVIKYVGILSGQAQWLCECDCGTRRVLRGQALRSGSVKCSCQKGWSKHPLYSTWVAFRSRHDGTVCDRWTSSFNDFIHDVGDRPKGLILTRTDKNKPFSKNNYKWVSYKETPFATNNAVMITHDGKTMNMSDWAKHLGITRERMRQRVADGLPDDLMFASKHKKKQIALSLRKRVAADLRGKQPKPADVIKLAKKYGVKEWLIARAITHNRNIVVA